MYLENLVFGKLCICPVSILLLLPGIGVSLAGTNGWEDFHCGFTFLQRESEYKPVLFPACGGAEPGKQGIPRNTLKGIQTKQQDPHSSWGSSFILEGQEMHWVWCLYQLGLLVGNLTLCHIKLCVPEAWISVQKGFLYPLDKVRADTVFCVYTTCFMKAALSDFPPKLQALKQPREKACHERNGEKLVTWRRK